MGSRGYYDAEEPIHTVTIAEPFWLAETPVTQAQFALWTRADGIEHKNKFEGRPEHPAENLDWRQAMAYCAWLTRVKAGEMPPGFDLACLPTEAEWEYACRAGTDTEYHLGDGVGALAETGWFGEEWDSGTTHPVGWKRPNAFGLFDMHGNVWEWCLDVFDPKAYRKRSDNRVGHAWSIQDAGVDAETWESGKPTEANANRVLRGGSWYRAAWFCRSACRFRRRPGGRFRDDGFRVCLVRGPAAGTEEEQTGAEVAQAPGDEGRRDEGRSRTGQAPPKRDRKTKE
jgi:formylglycine-generating enzyme required for sulfatase activity